MHGFQDNEVVLPTGYDVIVRPPPGGAARDFHDRFRKSDHDFLIVIHSNFLSAMHVFRDNEVLLQAGNDVIVISPPKNSKSIQIKLITRRVSQVNQRPG